ncbi:MAG: SDR family NAD(P)-dependent oxidoreductase, partial [Candidatus Magasanikbacteria bacterium]|nr:SDR family NAD(P)-dependent oxidoreductase [Candidatus Magasanikbacteria bacterium]
GIFGLIKSVLAMNKKMLPPSLNLHEPNEKVNWEESPIFINNRLQSWETKGETRRAGISSFGLSGTNCHVVLEEASQWKKTTEPDLIGRQIFVLSARSREVLLTIMKLHIEFFKKNSELDLEALCYTASTGRAHLNVRLVLVINTISELIEKLENYLSSNKIGSSEDGIYFGEFKIVPFGQKLKQDGEITEKESLAQAGEMEIIAQELFFSQKEDSRLVDGFCQAYVGGASFDWLKLYKNKRYQKIALPLYPFARERCWLDVPGAEKFGGYYQATRWVRCELENISVDVNKLCLVFVNDSKKAKNILGSLQKKKAEIIKVKIGGEFSKINRNFFQIRPMKEDYARLLPELSERKIVQVIHLLSLSDKTEIDTLEELNDSQKQGVQSLLFLTQALQNNFASQSLDLSVITDRADKVSGNEKEIKPENATLVGFGKSVLMESPNIRCRVIDWDHDSKVDLLTKELNSLNKEYKIAYRDNERYIEELATIDFSEESKLSSLEQKEPAVKIRPGGVYLITGGTGGIGLEVARRLAKEEKVKLVLISRHALPAREEWENILTADGPRDKRLLRQIENLQTIEKSGSEILFLQADIADWGQTEKALKMARKKFGEINGIIHAAGTAGDGFIANKGEAELRRVLAPKVQGTWILERLTRNDNLDFFVLFSSAVTLVSGLGVSDYVAANSYLD